MVVLLSILNLGIQYYNKSENDNDILLLSNKKEVSIKEQVANGAFLVDVRTPQEFAEGSVKGAVNIPLDEVESRLNEFKGKPSVIVFCRTGNRSGQAKAILEYNGIKNVTNGINTKTVNEELAK